jgi:hypothetical protein
LHFCTFPHAPRLAPCVRLSSHTAQHLWSISMEAHEASVSISATSTRTFTRVSSHFANMHEPLAREQLARSLGTLFVAYSLYFIFPQARGLRHQSSSWCPWLSHGQTTTPHPPLPEASGFRWGLPYLLPTPLDILLEASRVRHGRLKRNEVGGVFLAAPSALCGSPVSLQGKTG